MLELEARAGLESLGITHNKGCVGFRYEREIQAVVLMVAQVVECDMKLAWGRFLPYAELAVWIDAIQALQVATEIAQSLGAQRGLDSRPEPVFGPPGWRFSGHFGWGTISRGA